MALASAKVSIDEASAAGTGTRPELAHACGDQDFVP
jgi:hypothetical protein